MLTMAGEVTGMHTTQLEFTEIARALQAECGRLGMVCPALRTPPRSRAERTIRHCPNGVVVAVRLDRDPHAVTSDLIDGCIAAQSELDPQAVELLRGALWEAAGTAVAA